MSTVHDRLQRLAGVAENATAALDLRDAERDLARRRREPVRLTTAAGQALAVVTAERRAVERAARAAELRSYSDLATANAAAAQKGNP